LHFPMVAPPICAASWFLVGTGRVQGRIIS
jgi:hypothetical protein